MPRNHHHHPQRAHDLLRLCALKANEASLAAGTQRTCVPECAPAEGWPIPLSVRERGCEPIGIGSMRATLDVCHRLGKALRAYNVDITIRLTLLHVHNVPTAQHEQLVEGDRHRLPVGALREGEEWEGVARTPLSLRQV